MSRYVADWPKFSSTSISIARTLVAPSFSNSNLELTGQELREHLHRRVRHRQQRAVALREHVAWLAVIRHRHRVAVFGDPQVLVLGRKQHLVIDVVAELAHDALEGDEIEHVPALGVERALDHDARAIVVAVQGLAAMAGERDEVRGGEDQIVLRDRDAILTAVLHRFLRGSHASHR